jgi:hypothetical protein
MSTRKAPENASGSKGLKPWMKNLIFAAVILVLAAALYFGVRAAHSSKGSGLQATVDFCGRVSVMPSRFWTVSARTMSVSNSAGWTRTAHGLHASLPGCMW